MRARRAWACTRAEVPWIGEGFASQPLHCLLYAYGVFARDRHRALADCEAGVWLLEQPLPVSGRSVLAAMRRRALTRRCACGQFGRRSRRRRCCAPGATGGRRRHETGSSARRGSTSSRVSRKTCSRGGLRGNVALPAPPRDPAAARECVRALAGGSGRLDGRKARLSGYAGADRGV